MNPRFPVSALTLSLWAIFLPFIAIGSYTLSGELFTWWETNSTFGSYNSFLVRLLFAVGVAVLWFYVAALITMSGHKLQWLQPFVVRPSRKIVVRSLAVVALVAVSITCAFTYRAWGYLWSAPATLLDAGSVDKILELSTIKNWNTGGLEIDSKYSLSDLVGSLSQFEKGSGDAPSVHRALKGLDQAQLIAAPAASAGTLEILEEYFQRLSAWQEAESTYETDAKSIYAMAMRYTDRTGAERIFLAFHTGQLSNDHYAYYEQVLAPDGRDSAAPWTAAYTQKFYYDVAGMEGWGGWALLAFLAIPCIAFLLPPLLLGWSFRHYRRNLHLAAMA